MTHTFNSHSHLPNMDTCIVPRRTQADVTIGQSIKQSACLCLQNIGGGVQIALSPPPHAFGTVPSCSPLSFRLCYRVQKFPIGLYVFRADLWRTWRSRRYRHKVGRWRRRKLGSGWGGWVQRAVGWVCQPAPAGGDTCRRPSDRNNCTRPPSSYSPCRWLWTELYSRNKNQNHLSK